jgi:hypothetical protein
MLSNRRDRTSARTAALGSSGLDKRQATLKFTQRADGSLLMPPTRPRSPTWDIDEIPLAFHRNPNRSYNQIHIDSDLPNFDNEVKTATVGEVAAQLLEVRNELATTQQRVHVLNTENDLLLGWAKDLKFTISKHEQYNAAVSSDRDRLVHDLHALRTDFARLKLTISKHEQYNAAVSSDRDRLVRDLHTLRTDLSWLSRRSSPVPAPTNTRPDPTSYDDHP